MSNRTTLSASRLACLFFIATVVLVACGNSEQASEPTPTEQPSTTTVDTSTSLSTTEVEEQAAEDEEQASEVDEPDQPNAQCRDTIPDLSVFQQEEIEHPLVRVENGMTGIAVRFVPADASLEGDPVHDLEGTHFAYEFVAQTIKYSLLVPIIELIDGDGAIQTFVEGGGQVCFKFVTQIPPGDDDEDAVFDAADVELDLALSSLGQIEAGSTTLDEAIPITVELDSEVDRLDVIVGFERWVLDFQGGTEILDPSTVSEVFTAISPSFPTDPEPIIRTYAEKATFTVEPAVRAAVDALQSQ